MGTPVEVGRYRYRYLAEVALGLLEDAGIQGVVVADDVGGTYAGIAPARLLVASEHAERARDVLEEAEEEAPIPDERD